MNKVKVIRIAIVRRQITRARSGKQTTWSVLHYVWISLHNPRRGTLGPQVLAPTAEEEYAVPRNGDPYLKAPRASLEQTAAITPPFPIWQGNKRFNSSDIVGGSGVRNQGEFMYTSQGTSMRLTKATLVAN